MMRVNDGKAMEISFFRANKGKDNNIGESNKI